MRAVKIMTCALALAAFLAPGARADEWNKLTYLTFSAPVQLPGVTLPAGTYAFKLADTWSNRHVVQVFDKDQSKIYGTFLTVSDQKLDPPDKPVVMFRESAAGTPSAVRAWFYPGDTTGDEFVYPKDQAVKIAKATHQPVMTTDSDVADGSASKMKGWKVGHVDENGSMTSDDNDNRADAYSASAASTAQATAGATSAGTSGTTGTYTAAPRENDHRTGVSENGDTMNRYNPHAQAGSRTTNPSMAAGGETVTSTGATAQAGTSAQNGATANRTSNDRAMHDRREPTGTTAVGTSGQADAAANARPTRRHLPRTASPLGLMELLSGLSLAGALGVRQMRKALSRG